MGAVARKTLAVTLVMMGVLVSAGAARGAEYKVHACGADAHYENHLFVASVSDSRMEADSGCPTDGQGHNMGVAARAGTNKGTVPMFASATQSFLAPTGTSIQRVHLKGEGRTWNGDWGSLLQGSNDRFDRNVWTIAGCAPRPGGINGCVSAWAPLDQDYELRGATGFRSIVSCGQIVGCTTFGTAFWPFTRDYYFIREFNVTLEDPSRPAITVTGGGLASGNWIRGTQGVSYRASDNSGVYRSHFTVDALGVIDSDDRKCDYTYAVPCTPSINGAFSFDTARVSDGTHRVFVDAVDATNVNWATAGRTVNIDNHAPAEPASPSVVGGEAWHTTDDFTIGWTNPASAAPINRAFYEICKADGSACSSGSQAATGISQLNNVHVGQPGDYKIRVWLSDAAGNVSDAKSTPLRLKFDNVPPAQAAPQRRNGWVNDLEGRRFVQEIGPPLVGAPPVSGIAGYAVTVDGSLPGTVINVPASAAPAYLGRKELHNLPEGMTLVRARAISGAGIPSLDVGVAAIYVDRSPPSVSIADAPDANSWSRHPLALRLTAADRDGLSGMASAPRDRDIAAGGYIRYGIDAGPLQQVRGPERELGPDGRLEYVPEATADVSVATDGPHTISYQATDVAGNVTSTRSLTFKIDQTPPELAVFEPQSAADPKRVTVAASDRTSGLGKVGEIRLRRIAPSLGPWISLRAIREDDRYYARIDNATLPEGDYEFRATISDQAGNEAFASADRAGRPEIIHMTPTKVGPYSTVPPSNGPPRSGGPDSPDAGATVDTRIAAWAIERAGTRRPCKRPTGRRGRRTCPRPPATETLVHELRVPFGKRVTIKGQLKTATGRPIAGTEVTVLARLRMAGAEYRAEASVSTDSTGAFTYRAPARAGRTLDFHYRGDKKYKHADDQVTLRVPATATITANKHRIRNGRRIRFTGRLKGAPYPEKGKLLDLQAYYRSKWRTFATPRAGRNGKWTYSYRFQATRGSVLYRFRVRARATSDYPYEVGYSKTTAVRVSGP
jgi:hypothetical protein